MPVTNNGNTTGENDRKTFQSFLEISRFKKLGVITETQPDGSGIVLSAFF